MHAAMVFGGSLSFCTVALGVFRAGVHFFNVGNRDGIGGGGAGFDATGRPRAGDGPIGGGWRGSAGIGLGWYEQFSKEVGIEVSYLGGRVRDFI